MLCRLFFFSQGRVWCGLMSYGACSTEAWWWTVAQRRYILAGKRAMSSFFFWRSLQGDNGSLPWWGDLTRRAIITSTWRRLSILHPHSRRMSLLQVSLLSCPTRITSKINNKKKVLASSIYLIILVYALVFLPLWVVMSRSPELPTPHSITCSTWLRGSVQWRRLVQTTH